MNLINLNKRILQALKDNPPPPLRINLTQGNAMPTPTPIKEVNLTSPIKYSLNESITIDITPIPNLTNLMFEVDRYAGGGHDPITIEGVAASTYTTIVQSLNGGAALFELPQKWATVSNLKVFPFAGKGLNAYYNRKYLAFFYAQNKKTKEWFFTSASPDIVAHELGHAILDALRPDLWNAASLEIWSFHEAFGDITSMLSLMQYPEVIKQILSSTNGNIRKHNIASDVAESFSKILLANGYQSMDGFLRSGINDYKYIDPQFLPENGPLGTLTKEPHNFSQIFFATAYDLLVLFYEDNLKLMPPEAALETARDTLATYIFKATKNAPASVRFFESVCKTLLWVDFNWGKRYHDRMKEIFSNRNIISYDLSAMSLGDLSGEIKDQGEGMMIVCKSKHDTLCNCSTTLKIQNYDPMSEINLSILRTDAYIHNKQGQLIDVHKVSEHVAIEAAEDMVKYLQNKSAISDEPTTPFEIQNGTLQRTLICCCGGGKPLKNSPEYNKQYKPENNSGCCSGCKETDKKVIKRKIKRGCFTRYKTNS